MLAKEVFFKSSTEKRSQVAYAYLLAKDPFFTQLQGLPCSQGHLAQEKAHYSPNRTCWLMIPLLHSCKACSRGQLALGNAHRWLTRTC